MKLSVVSFVPEILPVFERKYYWLHSSAYKYSYADQPYGLPGSYRMPFTNSWNIANLLALKEGRAQVLKVLRTSKWDGGTITGGVDPATAAAEVARRAFTTAAGYVRRNLPDGLSRDCAVGNGGRRDFIDCLGRRL